MVHRLSTKEFIDLSSPQTDNKADYLFKLRHSAAHVLAEAVKQLFPETKLTIGPPTEDGFYYDFDSSHRFTVEDLQTIEDQMRKNLKDSYPFVGEEKNREEAKKFSKTAARNSKSRSSMTCLPM